LIARPVQNRPEADHATPVRVALERRPRAIPRLRWWIGGLLLASTLINYTDRQTLALLAPFLKQKYTWTNTDYANIIVAFRVAYFLGQVFCGRLMDRLGTRRGLSLTVLWYSLASIFTPLARGLYGFMGMRFLLGAGESGNWPGATKAVSEWFPRQERALATALFDSGSSLGVAIAPLIVLPLYFHWGLGAAFVLPGIFGFIWLIVWRLAYDVPERHTRIGSSELRFIIEGRGEDADAAHGRLSWRDLLRLRQTWGTIIARAFSDPVFFFVADWFPIYLVTKGISLRSSLFVIWIPFAGTDLGNILGGWLSGFLIQRGLSVAWARKSVMCIGALGVTALIPTVFTANLNVLIVLFSIACFCYGLFTTVANVLPSDLFFPESVASVSGVSGSAAALCTIVVFELAGRLSDARAAAGTHIFDPLMALSGSIPFVGMILVLWLVRNTRAVDKGLVRKI
jgi:MFS transporter, ACS family, hexuronate transporter